jgi:multiple antibiotic resistance protein
MGEALNLFIGTFTTLLAVINPLEAMPIFLQLLYGRDEPAHRRVALHSCLYATILMFFFLVFGTLIMRVFGVPLSMVRIVGGIILMRLGFEFLRPPLRVQLSPTIRAKQTREMSPSFPWLCRSWSVRESSPPFWAWLPW